VSSECQQCVTLYTSTLRGEEQNILRGPPRPHVIINFLFEYIYLRGSETGPLVIHVLKFCATVQGARIRNNISCVVPLETVVVLWLLPPISELWKQVVMVSREHSTNPLPPEPTTDPSLFSSYIQLSKVLMYISTI
jgi:hypothetical protein